MPLLRGCGGMADAPASGTNALFFRRNPRKRWYYWVCCLLNALFQSKKWCFRLTNVQGLCKAWHKCGCGGMAYAVASGAIEGNFVQVQVLSAAFLEVRHIKICVFFLCKNLKTNHSAHSVSHFSFCQTDIHVGVSFGHFNIRMPKPLFYFFQRYTFRKQHCSAAVPLQYNNAKSENPVKSRVAGVGVIYFHSISN